MMSARVWSVYMNRQAGSGFIRFHIFCCFTVPAAASKLYEAKMVPVIRYLMSNTHMELPEGWPADWAP
jgi:hypothetical protein